MSSTPLPRHSRSRRRLAAWAAFGVAGLAAGAVWATGFDTVSGSGTNTISPALTRTAPAAQADRLAGTAQKGTDPVYNFQGYQGSVDATSVFTIDLSGQPANETFNVGLLLATADELTGWSTIQLKWDMVTAAGASCDATADFGGASFTAARVMRFDSQDARVGWTGVAGGAKYCIGLRASDGRDINGTFLQSASETDAPSVYPSFVATVDRATSP